jgi:hemerythrin-like domain-containing protein
MPGDLTTDVSDMFTVHQTITGALDSAPELITRDPNHVERARVIGSFFENVLEFLHVHHQGEDDLIYPKLRERCPDAWPTIDHIDHQHQLVHQPTRDAIDAIAAWRNAPSTATAQAAVNALARVDEVVKPHLAMEETVVLPYCSAWITQEEWSELPGHAMAAFQGDKPWLAFGLIRERLTPEQRDEMHNSMPPPLRQLWDNEWSPAYEAFMAEVRSHS